jgi:TIR domain
VCRACATQRQMDAIRAEERSRQSGPAESANERGRNRPARLRLSAPRCYVPPVDVNLLYLQSSPSVTGRDALRGRSLLDAFRRRFADVHLAYSVVPDQEIQAIQERVRADFFAASNLDAAGINCLYLEGGLFAARGQWKIEERLARGFVERGGLLVIADVNVNAARDFKADYETAFDLLGSGLVYGPSGRSAGQPLYGIDETRAYHGARHFRCMPEKMAISEWLRPVYEDVASVAVSLPAIVRTFADILASGNGDTSGTLINDVWCDEKDAFPFAAAHRYGAGYVVLIAAGVSHDLISERGDNARWLGNTVDFLLADIATDAARRRPLRDARDVLFLSHRSVDKLFVQEVAAELKVRGIRPWLDRDQLAIGDSLPNSVGAALGAMTGFVLFWSAACPGAPWVDRELAAATSLLTPAIHRWSVACC